MIETSLIRLDEAAQNGKQLHCGTKCILPTGYEAEIYGFIAIDDKLFADIDMPPLGECQVLSNRAIFYLDKKVHSFPIFSSVSKPTNERYGLYLLYIPRFMFSLKSENQLKYYLHSMSREKPHSSVGQIDGIRIEDNTAYYYPIEDDLYFESKTKFRGIGRNFAVVIRRLSKQSDNFKYELFDSHCVMIER